MINPEIIDVYPLYVRHPSLDFIAISESFDTTGSQSEDAKELEDPYGSRKSSNGYG